MVETHKSFEDYLKDQAKEQRKAVLSATFFRLEEMTYDIANGRNKAARMETAEKMQKMLQELEELLQNENIQF